MIIKRLLQESNRLFVVLTILYTLALLILSLVSKADLPEPDFSFADKVFHFVAYAILAFLWYNVFFRHYNMNMRKALSYAIGFAMLFGIVLEFLQEYTTSSRQLDIYDIIANTLGALSSLVILRFKRI